jgi:hypothetical protein
VTAENQDNASCCSQVSGQIDHAADRCIAVHGKPSAAEGDKIIPPEGGGSEFDPSWQNSSPNHLFAIIPAGITRIFRSSGPIIHKGAIAAGSHIHLENDIDPNQYMPGKKEFHVLRQSPEHPHSALFYRKKKPKRPL